MNEKNNKKKIEIFGFHPLLFLSFVVIMILNIVYMKIDPENKKLWHPLLTPLFIAMVLGIGLNYIGYKTPFLNKLGFGFLLSILVPSFLIYQKIIPKNIADNFDKAFFNKPGANDGLGINFSQFFITIVISGSLLSVDRDLLKRSLIKFIPITLIAIIFAFVVSGFLGYLVDFQPDVIFLKKSQGSFWDSIFFVFVPLTNGGTNLGIGGFSNGIYKDAFKGSAEASQIRSVLLAPLILARVLSIFFAGLLFVLFDKTKYSGKGSLGQKKIGHSHKSIKSPLEHKQIGMGLLIIFALYNLGNMINQVLCSYLDAMVYVIIILLVIKIFDLLSDKYQNSVSQAGKFMSINFTGPVLAGLGLTTNFANLINTLKTPSVVLIVVASLTVAAITTFILAQSLGFYPLELSLTAGLCSHSVGGTGNLGVMAISHREDLLPFATIATRVVGPLVYIVSTFGFKYLYM
ncbi:2-hydroxycarboxylate transporter family protein [Italian clover phyllody phytoplasma]|uniref:2-hydroxycarboxylate transporter family protein n=1 Tax=Italian clover phyllody phytoplasma TaxID=1196420 RepID=UPI00030A5804|nr:2-hydroxycarboxylate transporter family protein [Italian clover phyllody phytoplasma]